MWFGVGTWQHPTWTDDKLKSLARDDPKTPAGPLRTHMGTAGFGWTMNARVLFRIFDGSRMSRVMEAALVFAVVEDGMYSEKISAQRY